MSALFSHANSNLATEEDIRKVPVPAKTRSYCPVPNGILVDMIREKAHDVLGAKPVKEQFALSKNNQRMFGTMTFESDSDETGISFGFGNCYDMSIKLRFAAGAQVFICDNLCYSGDSITYARKHTTHIFKDLEEKMLRALWETRSSYEKTTAQLDRLKDIPCSLDEGYKLLGLARGHGIIKSTAYNIALEDWSNPRVFETEVVKEGEKEIYTVTPFSEKNMYSLYNCFTEGVKKGDVGKRIERQASLHQFMMSDYVHKRAFPARMYS